jgi:hypothetical protein
MVAKRAIKIRNRVGGWTAEGLLGEMAKAAHAAFVRPKLLGAVPSAAIRVPGVSGWAGDHSGGSGALAGVLRSSRS